jgi:hypothetical protein
MEYKNAKRIKNGLIDCEINHPDYGWIPFTCDPNDNGAAFDVSGLHARMSVDPATLPYTAPTQAQLNAAKAEEVRAERDNRLARDVDPIAGNALRWASLTEDQRQAWADYRQALLDVPQQEGFPYNVVWPVKPD